MRAFAIAGLVLSLAMAGVAVFSTAQTEQSRRRSQEHALSAALSSAIGRVAGSQRQMATTASQLAVNPAVAELLSGARLHPAQRRADVVDAARALDAFLATALVPAESVCIDDTRASQVACNSAAGRILYPARLRLAFAAIASRSPGGVPSGTYPSPLDGRATGAFVLPLRIGGALAGLVHFDMASVGVEHSTLLVRDVPGVTVRLAIYRGRHRLPAVTVSAPAARGMPPALPRWQSSSGGHRTMVALLPMPIGRTQSTLAILATESAPDPVFANAWKAGMLAVLALALMLLAGSLAALAMWGRRVARELTIDPLTRLRNRRALMEELPRACLRASEEAPAFLYFFDLNGFKNYNDAFGHLAGDALLARLGARLQQTLGPLGTVYRLGGDEFCALVSEPVSDPLALFHRAREALSERGGAFEVTASAGAVEIPREAAEPTQALRLADHHMYRDKSSLRGRTAEMITAVLHAALAERHPELDEHSSDVAADVEMLAQGVGLDEEAVRQIVRAGDLHDVGKLGIPDEIISKPGPLGEREWEFMRQHTIMGERIIAAAGPALEPLAPLVRSSHERWDGGGYPDGLAREEIPLGARIITICDSFRAMLDQRPYKRAMPKKEALAELRRCAGSQFDPALVEIFCRLIAERDRVQTAQPSSGGVSPSQ